MAQLQPHEDKLKYGYKELISATKAQSLRSAASSHVSLSDGSWSLPVGGYDGTLLQYKRFSASAN